MLELGRSSEARRLALHHHDPGRSDDVLDQIAADTAAWTKTRCPAMETMVAAEGLVIDVPPP